MPVLSDPFREAFCQFIAAGENQRDAFLKARLHAGNDVPITSASVSVKASQLMRKPEVRTRVGELLGHELKTLHPRDRQALAAAVNIAPPLLQTMVLTREWVIEQLIDNVKLAKRAATFNLNAANKALELLGREIGMFVEHRETMNVNYVLRDRPPTEDEWIAEHADRVN